MMESVFMFVVQFTLVVIMLGAMAVFLSMAVPLIYDAYKEFRKALK